MSYNDQKEAIELIKASYYGIGHYDDGQYCTPAPSESPTKYIYRTNVAKYTNFMKPIVDANVIPVGSGIERVMGGTYGKNFVKNVNGYGMTMKERMDHVRLDTLLFGYTVHFVVASTDQPESQKEVLTKGTSAKLLSISPSQICDIKLEQAGVIYFISWQSGEDDGVPIYTSWEKGEFYESKSGSFENSKEEMTNGIGSTKCQPKLFTYENYYNQWEVPVSRFKSLSEMAKSMYDEDSKVMYQTGATTFSILLMPDTTFKGENGTKLNDNNGLKFNGATSGGLAPSFISPENTIKEIMDVVINIKKDMYDSTNMNVLSTSADASGKSRAYSDTVRIESLKSIALKSKEFEEWVFDCVNTLANKQEEFSVTYPTDFASLAVEERLESRQMLIDAGVSAGNLKKVRTDMMEIVYMGSTEEEKKQFQINEESGADYNEKIFDK